MRVLRVAGSVLAMAAAAAFVFSAGASVATGQAGRQPTPRVNWSTYGGNLASQRYSPLDQLSKDNFNKLEIAWR